MSIKPILQLLDSLLPAHYIINLFATVVGGVSNFSFKSAPMLFFAKLLQISGSHGVSDEEVEVIVLDSKLLQPGVRRTEEEIHLSVISRHGIGPERTLYLVCCKAKWREWYCVALFIHSMAILFPTGDWMATTIDHGLKGVICGQET